MRKINVWRKSLQEELLVTDTIVQPAIGKTDSSIWRRNKNTGIITQFARGKKMRDYRAMIVGMENTKDPKE